MDKIKYCYYVCCGCETWFVIGREHRLRVFENRVLRRIFGPKREEVTGGWGRLYNEGDQIKKGEMSGARGTHGRYEKCVQNFGRKT
jgi:hypothetical protein